MNYVIEIGNMTKDPESRVTQAGDAVCNFTIAVQRRFKAKNGEREADFFNCVAWRQTATFISEYGAKGRKIAVVGELQNRQYEKDGQKRTVTEIVVSSAEFVAPKPEGEPSGAKAGEFVEVKDDTLPF